LRAQALEIQQLLHPEIVDRHAGKLEIIAFDDLEPAFREEA
jgi:hypothetical protein